jgi:hypothetical protein
MSDASSSNRHVSSPLGSTKSPTSINLVPLAGAGVGTGVGVGVGADVGADTGTGTGAGADTLVSGGSSGSRVSVTPITIVSLVAVVAATGLVNCLLSCLSFPVPRSGVKSDLTRPQQMRSNTVVVAGNRHVRARYSSPIFIIFLAIRSSAL